MQEAQNKRQEKKLLNFAELSFKLSFAIDPRFRPKFSYPVAWFSTYGFEPQVDKKELKLGSKNEELAVVLLHHVAIYILATQVDTALQNLFVNRFNHKNQDIKNASYIARLIRNAFTHNPFYPRWMIGRNARQKIFKIKKVIQIDTSSLDGKFVKWRDFGGPLALLGLSKFVRGL